ncbi:MAG: tetratricopeptide repeat protein [Bacteroidota bacterium]
MFLLSVCFMFLGINSFAQTETSSWQTPEIDSILVLLKNDKADKTHIFHLNDLTWECYATAAYDQAHFYADSSIRLANTLLKKATEQKVVNTLKKEIATSLTNKGLVYEAQGIYPEALKNHFEALKIMEGVRYEKGISACYNNIGNIYLDQSNLSEALKNYTKAFQIDKVLGSKSNLSNSYNNIGLVYYEQGKYEEALKNFKASLEIKLKKGNKKGASYTFNNIGLVYAQQKNYSEALKNYEISLKIEEEIGDQASIANSYNNIGDIYLNQKKYETAEKYFVKGRDLAKELNYIEILRDAYEGLVNLYSVKGNYKDAFANHKLYILYRDTLDNEKTRERIIQNQLTYDFEKKEAVANAEHEKELEKQNAVAEEKSAKQKLILMFVVFGLLIIIIFSAFVFRSLRVTRKQKDIIESQKNLVEEQKDEVELQKHLVEEKQKEIIDSITYAKRLQKAILPSTDTLKKYLPDSFVLYEPKDIVAGDFYWIHVNGDYVFIAAADSTGHGVPGAMVSIVCSNALNRAVDEFKLLETGKILDKTRDLVLETFLKSGEEIKDGMDISLLCINRAKQQITWSGANNQLWFIQNGSVSSSGVENKVLNEIKANKQAIGKTDNPLPFTTHTIALNRGDIYYLMTDGYPDQFGGPNGKKFKYKALSDKLITVAHLDLQEQKQELLHTFQDWKGELEQVDDVTVIGIKI